MKRQILSVLVGIALVGLLAGTGAWADSPHFIGTPTASIESDGTLDVKFKEAGLGLGQTTYLVNADATITCVCATNSGHCPNADNKSTGFTPVSFTGTFSPRHGTVSQTLSVPPPDCGTSVQPTCGGGQHFEVTDLSYTNIAIGDCTNGVPAGTTCTDSDSDGTFDTLGGTGGLATSPSTLSASNLFVCK